MRLQCPVPTENFRTSTWFHQYQNYCHKQLCTLLLLTWNADVAGGIKAASTQVCAPPARQLSHTQLVAHQPPNVSPRNTRESLVAVSPRWNADLKNIFYTLFLSGVDLNESFCELGKVIILIHCHSRSRLCGLVQPILSFRNQKPHTV